MTIRGAIEKFPDFAHKIKATVHTRFTFTQRTLDVTCKWSWKFEVDISLNNYFVTSRTWCGTVSRGNIFTFISHMIVNFHLSCKTDLFVFIKSSIDQTVDLEWSDETILSILDIWFPSYYSGMPNASVFALCDTWTNIMWISKKS